MKNSNQPTDTEDTNSNIKGCLDSAADSTLPKIKRKMKTNEIWKDDQVLNLLIEQRSKVLRASNEHKEFSKKIKKRVIFLRNEKLAREASELNDYSNRRQVEEPYSSFKSDHSSFKEHKSNQKCDPIKLREYFKKPFMAEATGGKPCFLSNKEFQPMLSVLDHQKRRKS